MSTTRLPTKWMRGRRTTPVPITRQARAVQSRRGLLQLGRPASTSRAGSRVIAHRNATMTDIEIAGTTAENTSSLVKTLARNATATVAAEAAITLPIDINAILTA